MSAYMQDSLELNLFYLRIMKEHALFLLLGFTPKNKDLSDEADDLRKRLDDLFAQAIDLSKGYISESVLSSGELFTRYTEDAERQTQFFTGVPIDIGLTMDEYSVGGTAEPPASMLPDVNRLNDTALSLTQELLRFKERVRDDVAACRIFTTNYPLILDHIVREAEDYIALLQNLRGQTQRSPAELAQTEVFWNDNMGEHAEFIDGLLDPTERAMKRTANDFAVLFENLTRQAVSAQRDLRMLTPLTRRSRAATEEIRNFKEQGTRGILSCKVRSIIAPLLSDHQLREANYYLRLLQ